VNISTTTLYYPYPFQKEGKGRKEGRKEGRREGRKEGRKGKKDRETGHQGGPDT
jgi:hypothetical protein